ncbi:hypothetical protein BC830DRAFT_1118583 [Chytriomyces sp. MP71]|nr:hypothetical protein BC830DRAFT_1118583 [Chytriomyces sp. MP71]
MRVSVAAFAFLATLLVDVTAAPNATSMAAPAASSAPAMSAAPSAATSGGNMTNTDMDPEAMILSAMTTSLQAVFGTGTGCFIGCLNGNPKNVNFTVASFQALCQLSSLSQAQASSSPVVTCITSNCPADLGPLLALSSDQTGKEQTAQACNSIFGAATNGTAAGAGSMTAAAPSKSAALSMSAASTGGAAASKTMAASATTSDAIKLAISGLALVVAVVAVVL